jgi:hypothetical protein
MTPNEKRAIRARQMDIKASETFLKNKPGFAATQHQAMSRGREFMEGLSEQEKQPATQQRLGVVLRLLDIRAEAYLGLVDDIASQEAYMTLLSSFADKAWEDFTGYPVYIARPFSDDPHYIAIGKAVSRWTEQGYKRAAEAENSRERIPAVEPPQEVPVGAGPTAFISYSWDSKEHREWVRAFAAKLKENGITVVMDRTHLKLGASATKFMESSVRDSQRVLVICTEAYKNKFDDRVGGAGYEGSIISGEIINQVGENKFIPILRGKDWITALPTALSVAHGVDLREDSGEEFERLVEGLLGGDK